MFARLFRCVGVCICVSETMFPRYLQYLLMYFCQTFVIGESWDKNELFRFWNRKVKGKAHSMTKYCPRLYVYAIAPVSLRDCLRLRDLVHLDVLIRFWGEKVKVQGHVAAEVSST